MDATYMREDPLLVDNLYSHPYDGLGKRRSSNNNSVLGRCGRSCHSRWAVLVPTCFLVFGSFFNYDFPGTLGTGSEGGTIQAKFEAHNKTYTQEMNQVLYSVYSWPNVVLALVGGFLIDRLLGIRKSLILFTLLITLGTGLFWLGTVTASYPLLVLGRVLLGLGGENGYVAQASMTSRWFKGTRGMSLAYGCALATNRLASLANFYLVLGFAEDYGVETATLIGFLVACFSMLCGGLLFLLDIRGERNGVVPPVLSSAASTSDNLEEPEDAISPDDEKESMAQSESRCCCCSSAKLPPGVLWLIAVIISLSFCSLFPFLGIAKNYFEVSQSGTSGRDASRLVSIFEICAVVCCPLFGAIVALTGRLAFFMVGSGILITGAYVLTLSLGASFPPVVLIIMLGIASAVIAASGWSSISLVVPRRLTGVSFGIALAIVNLGLAVVPLITGRILTENTPSPLPPPAAGDYSGGRSNSSSSISSYGGIGPSGSTPAAATAEEKHALPTEAGFVEALSVLLSCSVGALIGSIVLFVYSLRNRGPLVHGPSRGAEGRSENDRSE